MSAISFPDALAWQSLFAAYPFLWPSLAAFLGAVFASFGGVVVDRVPLRRGWTAQGFIDPDYTVNLVNPSRCAGCGHRINAIALAPVLGWLIYSGRCHSCGASVPAKYPLIEGGSAVVSALLALYFGPVEAGVWALCAWWVCVVVSWFDWRIAVIPDFLTVPLALAGLLASPFEPDVLLRVEGLAVCMTIVWVVYALAEALGRGEVPVGDVALAGAAGAWIGLQPGILLLAVFPAVFLLYGLPREMMGMRHPGGERGSPMGPAICVAFMGFLVFNDRVVQILSWMSSWSVWIRGA